MLTTWCAHQLKDNFIPHEGNSYHPFSLRHRTLWLYTVLVFLIKIAVISLSIMVPVATVYLAEITPENIVNLTNSVRQKLGIAVLKVDGQLSKAAEAKVKDMIGKSYFAHTSPEGVSPWFWVSQSGYNYVYAGENLALNFSTAEGVNSAWLASKTHKENIVNKNFQDIGVSVGRGTMNGKYTVLVVQMFGTRASESGTVKKKAQPQLVNNNPVRKPINTKIASVSKTVKGIETSSPTITSFADGQITNNQRPEISGQAQPLAQLEVVVDDEVVGKVTADSSGKYEFDGDEGWNLSEGEHIIWARDVNEPTKWLLLPRYRLTIDITAPVIDKDRSFILPFDNGEYKISAFIGGDLPAQAGDIARVKANSNGQTIDLSYNSAGLVWEGVIKPEISDNDEMVAIDILATDRAGNDAQDQLIYLQKMDAYSLYSLTTQESPNKFLGVFINDRFNDPANKFYFGFVVFLLVILLMDVIVGWRQHHWKPIMHLLLVLSISVAMMFV